jgi:alpha-beta hydrolase superfamily lysophospholipase
MKMTNQQQPLLTHESVALSLAPPRTPPRDSVIRNLYTNPRSAARLYNLLTSSATRNSNVLMDNPEGDDGGGNSKTSSYESHNLQSRFLQLLHDGNHLLHHKSHPHLPSSLSLPDQLIRFIGRTLPLEWQHRHRDNGTFRNVADWLVKLTCPMIGLGNLRLTHEFLNLSSRKRRRRIRYGDHHSMQYIDLFLPHQNDTTQKQNQPAVGSNNSTDRNENKVSVRGTLFFVHGGAWGSGHPWMYRLVAPAFLQRNFAVAIVGYRTYPDAEHVDDQVNDIRLAFDELDDVLNDCAVPVTADDAIDREEAAGDVDNDNGWVGNIMMGHSSGAHIALLLLVDMLGERMKSSSSQPAAYMTMKQNNRYPWSFPDYFVGLSGPYDISDHFDFEAGRGVEQISPMKPICGHSRLNFDRASPAKRLLSKLTSFREQSDVVVSSLTCSDDSTRMKMPTLQQITPPILFVHGIEDATVPFTATSDAARILKSCGLTDCHEIYLEKTTHQDVIMHFMMGGAAMDVVFDWLLRQRRQQKVNGRGGGTKVKLQLRSRL